MQGIEIVATARALPKKVVTNEELTRLVDTSDEWIRTRTGIEQRHYCEEETSRTLAVAAGKRALERAGISPEEIGVVIVATTTPEDMFPSVACMVQKELGMSCETMSFDINAACSGFLYGMVLCRALLATGKKEYALLIGSEEISKILDFEDRASCVLFGDGAGAAVIKKSEKPFFACTWSDGNAQALHCNGVGKGESLLRMEGREVFRFAVRAVEQGIEEVLSASGYKIEEMDYILCHQANRRIIEAVKKKYKTVEERFYINIENYANTSAASIPIALDEMFEKGLLKKGKKVLCVGFGAGFAWSSLIFEI